MLQQNCNGSNECKFFNNPAKYYASASEEAHWLTPGNAT